MAMWWIVVGVALGLTLLAAAVWLLAPSIRTFVRPGFEPTSKDDLSVYRAQSSGDSRGGGQ
jgi:hypothetical protein